MAEAKVINWEGALEQVAGDEEFLNEVLRDLRAEADTAENDLTKAIAENNLDAVMKAAHRIKGSASYLCCDQLRDVSFTLQNLGHSGIGLTDQKAIAAIMADVNASFVKFKQSLVALRAELDAKVPK